jgi:hypothetical protein
MNHRLPTPALLLGVAGLVPFIGLALLTLTAFDDAVAQRYLWALIGFGAVMLAFLGGVHWGFVLHPAALPESMDPAERRDAGRLALGVLPSLIGWAAMLTPLLAVPEIGLAILIVGYAGTVAAEAQLRRRDLVPTGYMAMRWGLSIVVVAILVTVLVLRLIGAKIAF